MPRGYTSAGADARASRRKVPQVADIEEDVEEEEEDEEYEDDGEAGPGPSTAATGGLSEEVSCDGRTLIFEYLAD